jgi:hypothetical protein
MTKQSSVGNGSSNAVIVKDRDLASGSMAST